MVSNGRKTGYVLGPRPRGFMTLNIGYKARLVFYLRNKAIKDIIALYIIYLY